MSDEESFVILGTSPMSSSIEVFNVEDKNRSLSTSEFNTSLRGSQVSNLRSALEISTQTPNTHKTQPEITESIKSVSQNSEGISTEIPKKTAANVIWNIPPQIQVAKSMLPLSLEACALEQEQKQKTMLDSQEKIAGSKLWNIPLKVQVEPNSETAGEVRKISLSANADDNLAMSLEDCAFKSLEPEEQQKSVLNSQHKMSASGLLMQAQVNEKLPLSLKDCVLKSPVKTELQQNAVEKANENTTSSINKEPSSINKTAMPPSVENNLAASFILGEVNSDVLKTSVYSQFPSISMEACAEDVLKLQNMVTEYSQLKSTIKKANNTMKLFYNNSIQWKDKLKTMEEQYNKQLNNCEKEIQELRQKNKEMELNFKAGMEALEIVRQKDREENIKEISEKNALLENMRAQIIKLEKQQLTSFEFVTKNEGGDQNKHFEQLVEMRPEQQLKIKELERKLSQIFAENLDFKDVQKQYIDELNCLKVNLTVAEELIKKNSAEIYQLTATNIEKKQQIQTLENSLKTLQLECEEQKERILLLETQNEVHRTDFEMEKQSRETSAKEKQQILQDLRLLQKKNQELIEEHQKMADTLQKRFSTASADGSEMFSTSAAAQTYFDNPQRPIRVLPASPSKPAASSSVAMQMCPICNKAFKSLTILLSHVNDCADKI